MERSQFAVGVRALDFLASFARETKDSLSPDVCRIYIKQVLDESENLETAACALQAAIIAKKPPECIQRDPCWKRLLDKFPDHQRAADEKRLIYNLTAIWTKEVLEHYGWHEQRKWFLQPLYQCAKAWPHFETQFTPAASCVLISRHEASILRRGHRRLKTIGFHHKTTALGFVRPLSLEDVKILAKWSKSGGVTAYGGDIFPVLPTERMLKHVEEWTEDTDGSVAVDGLPLKDQDGYHPAYNVIFDRFGLVVHCDEMSVAQCTAEKRRREDHPQNIENTGLEDGEYHTPVPKRTKMDSESMYPSPPHSSSLSSIMSSLPSSINGADKPDIRTYGASSSTTSTVVTNSTGPQREFRPPDTKEMNVGEDCIPIQTETLSQANRIVPFVRQDHPARHSSAVSSCDEILAKSTSLSQCEEKSSPQTVCSACSNDTEASRLADADLGNGERVALSAENQSSPQPDTPSPTYDSTVSPISSTPAFKIETAAPTLVLPTPSHQLQTGLSVDTAPVSPPKDSAPSETIQNTASQDQDRAASQLGSLTHFELVSLKGSESCRSSVSKLDVTAQARINPCDSRPSERTTTAQARAASLSGADAEIEQRTPPYRHRPPPALSLPSASVQSESLSQPVSFDLAPQGMTHFDDAFPPSCSSFSSNEHALPPLFPIPASSQGQRRIGGYHLSSLPPRSAESSTSGSWTQWIQKSPANSANSEASRTPLCPENRTISAASSGKSSLRASSMFSLRSTTLPDFSSVH